MTTDGTAEKSCTMAYQIGTIRSLITGVYEGDITFRALANYGNFGLGTFDGVDGEMIALDGDFYRIDARGKSHQVSPDRKTPFGIVTHFQEIETKPLHAFQDLGSLQENITSFFESKNIIYAIRIDGSFKSVKLRSEHPQPSGHRPLSETMARVQTTFTFQEINGTMVGFWFPQYLQAINVPGFHFHFLDSSHTMGGHLFEVELHQGSLQLMPLFDFGMHLLHTPLFEQADLNSTHTSAIDKVEKEQ